MHNTVASEFVFDSGFKVSFCGSQILVYEAAGESWELIYERVNPWRSKSKENAGRVMGRQFKPRYADAVALLLRAQTEYSKVANQGKLK